MNIGNSILTFIAGAAVGAVVALLVAPDSGAKTREKIIEGLDMLEAALEEK